MTFPPYLAAIPCQLSASVFSGECVFEVALADGGRYESTAPQHFCWGEDGHLVANSPPLPRGSSVPGVIAVKVVDLPNKSVAAVEVPDGEVIEVPSADIRARPTEIIPPRSVPA
jgi:hypothetical protein